MTGKAQTPRDIERLAIGADWLTSLDAARELGITTKSLGESVRHFVTFQNRNTSGRGARGVGWAYSKADIQKVKEIRDATGYDTINAARVLAAVRLLSELGTLKLYETQFSLPIGKARKRPRRRS